jgi:hypothetical protein
MEEDIESKWFPELFSTKQPVKSSISGFGWDGSPFN